jgi:hypothetical protein
MLESDLSLSYFTWFHNLLEHEDTFIISKEAILLTPEHNQNWLYSISSINQDNFDKVINFEKVI